MSNAVTIVTATLAGAGAVSTLTATVMSWIGYRSARVEKVQVIRRSSGKEITVDGSHISNKNAKELQSILGRIIAEDDSRSDSKG